MLKNRFSTSSYEAELEPDTTRLTGLTHEAEDYAKRLPSLLVEAHRTAQNLSFGLHGRKRAGIGENFWQFRVHENGEPASLIDWRQSARSKRLYVREREWEATQTVWILCDMSASMRYRSSRSIPFKLDAAIVTAGTLVRLLVQAGEKVALAAAGHEPRSGQIAITQFNLDVERKVLPQQTLKDDLKNFRPKRFSKVLIFSDFLEDLSELNEGLQGLINLGIKPYLIQILDPSERNLPFSGRTRFNGLEQEDEVLIPQVEEVRHDFNKLVQDQCEQVAAYTKKWGLIYRLHTTDQPFSGLLRYCHIALSSEELR